MRITIKNHFHGTQSQINGNIGDKLSKAQVNKLFKALCGMDDCYCGGLMCGDETDDHAIGRDENGDLIIAR